MKKTSVFIVAISTLFVISCKKETTSPKVIYDNATVKVKIETTVIDTTLVEIADLPIQLQGTNFLIHPIAALNIYGKNVKSNYESSVAVNDISFKISNFSESEITGYLINLKFQKAGSDSLRLLTNKKVLIQTVTFLKSTSDKLKKQILVYTLADSDTNKDNKIDSNDIKTLYISTVSGTNFTKVAPDLQELIDWKVIGTSNRLYFRTIEDTNKNGEFDKNDTIHYQFMDLASKDWKVSNYNPI